MRQPQRRMTCAEDTTNKNPNNQALRNTARSDAEVWDETVDRNLFKKKPGRKRRKSGQTWRELGNKGTMLRQIGEDEKGGCESQGGKVSGGCGIHG